MPDETLSRARAVNLAGEELPALVALAELHRREGEPEQARVHIGGCLGSRGARAILNPPDEFAGDRR